MKKIEIVTTCKERIGILFGQCGGIEQAAKRLGMSVEDAGRIVTWELIPTKSMRKKICKEFGIRPAWLDGGGLRRICEEDRAYEIGGLLRLQ